MRINGFRPGKVPVAHLKRVYGRSVMAEVVQETINAANKQIVDDNGLRLAMRAARSSCPPTRPRSRRRSRRAATSAFKIALEVLPKFEIGDFAEISLERPVAEVEESEVEAALQRLADARRIFHRAARGAKARSLRPVTIDFVGTIDGESFEGGSGKDIEVVLGSNTFIPGFEEQLLGVVAGEKRVVERDLPRGLRGARSSPARRPSST